MAEDPRIQRIKDGIEVVRTAWSKPYGFKDLVLILDVALLDLQAWQDILEAHSPETIPGTEFQHCDACDNWQPPEATRWPCFEAEHAIAALDRMDLLWRVRP